MTASNHLVLIGEPDQATRLLYQRALGQWYQVVAVDDQRSLWEQLTNQPIAAVVLEPALLAELEWQQLAEISQLCQLQAIPLVICTTRDERRRGVELGVAAYLIKPTLPQLLLETIRSVIG